MSQQNVDLVQRHFEQIWNLRDAQACDDLMAEDFVENGAAPFAARAPVAYQDRLPCAAPYSG